MQYLILGATGYIGSYLYHQLVKDGYKVIGTSRRTDNYDNLFFFDIRKSDIESIYVKADKEETVAIICIAESKIDRCCENYDQAYNINVTSTIKLIRKLTEKNFRIIFFSSDNVFDGISGNYTEESCTNPINKYGIMKAYMEQYILANVPKACILRIPKVVSTVKEQQNVFTEWEKQIDGGRVRCIKGNRLSFVYVDDIYHACLLVSEKNLSGLYNIAGDKAYSRAELAKKFYDKMGNTSIDIYECNIGEFSFKDKRPLNLEMSSQKFKNVTGYQFRNMDYVIEQYLKS